MLCSILTCMYRIYSRKKRTCGAHSVHKRIHLKDTAQQDQCYNNNIVIISHTLPATLKASKSKPLQSRGVVGQQRFRKQIMPFILSMLVFGELIVAHSKLHPKNPFANLWDDGACYPTTEVCLDPWPPLPSKVWLWHRCQLSYWSCQKLGKRLVLLGSWDGLWRWRVKWWPWSRHVKAFVWDTSTSWLQSFGICAAHVKSTERFQTHAVVSMSSE